MALFEDEEFDIITLVDDDGKEAEYAFLVLVELDAGQYAVLCPAEQLSDEEAELELSAFAYTESDDGEITLDAVESEELHNRVLDIAEEALFGDDDDYDDYDDEDDATDDEDDEGDEGEEE